MYRDQVRDRRQKAKGRERPNGKRTYEPQKEMVVNVQRGSSRQIEEMKMTNRIRRVQVGHERWRQCRLPRRAGGERFLNTKSSKLTDGQIVKHIDMMKPELRSGR